MKANQLTDNQKEILLHRLQSGCIEDCFADTEELNVTYEETEIAVHHVILMIKNNDFDMAKLTPLELLVVEDCLTGSTFFADIDDAVATSQLTKGKMLAYGRAADALESMLSQIIGHRVNCVRF